MQFLTKRTLLPLLALGMVATSCQDEDFGFTKQDVFNSAYSRTVQNLFGNVAPDQSWDFTSSATTRATEDYVSICTTVGDDLYNALYPGQKYYTIKTSTVNWFRENLEEGVRHDGDRFSFKIRKNEQFEILPVYVGWSVLCTELHMVIDQGGNSTPEDILLFKKNPLHTDADNYDEGYKVCEDGPTIIQKRDYCPTCRGCGWHSNKKCTVCGGKGVIKNSNGAWINCDACKAHGYWCETCQGLGFVGAADGEFACTLCDANGNSVCLECAGDGRTVQGGDTNCPYCHRSKIRPCTVCNGTKKANACPNCTPEKCHQDWRWMSGVAECKDGHIVIRDNVIENYHGGDFWYNVSNPWDINTRATKNGYQSGDHAAVRFSNFSHSMDAYEELRATSYIVDANKMNLPEGTEIWFYLKVTNGDEKTPTGTVLTSHSDRMMLVDMPTPDNINPNYTCKIIGIDDSFNSDSDHNDILFMVVSNEEPEIIIYEDEEVKTIKKRYLCEDLGSAFDLDFNDIVVDVTQTTKRPYKINTETGDITWDPAIITQEATVKHLCGTLPIQVQVGEYVFGRVTDPTDNDLTKLQLEGDATALASTKVAEQGKSNTANNCPDVTAQITGWKPDKNNVTVKVWMNGLDGTSKDDVWISEFPTPGSKTPYIIAVDQDFQWMPEGTLLTPDDLRKGGDFSNKKSN